MLLCLLVPILAKVSSTWRFQRSYFPHRNLKISRDPPIAPYWDFALGHFLELAWNTHRFLAKTIQLASRGPVEVQAGLIDFIVVSRPEQIQKVFQSCKHLSNKHMAVVALQNIFGASKEVAQLFEDHEVSHEAEHAVESGNVDESHPEGEVQLKDHVSAFGRYARKYLSNPHLDGLMGRFLLCLERNTNLLAIQEDWMEFPDLYVFLQGLVSQAAIEALMGSTIFQLHPDLVHDFWTFERGTPQFIRCWPRWLMRTQYNARQRIFETLKKLETLAPESLPRLEADSPEWEPHFGSKFLRARHEYGIFRNSLPDDTKAWEKMGIMFGSNANLLPTVFWYIFEALRDESVGQRMTAEVRSCLSSTDRSVSHNLGSLLQQPLLQSAYAETLRTRVAIATPRTCESDGLDLFGHKIAKNKHILIFTWPMIQDNEAWARSGKPPLRPFEEFWAERFLVAKGHSNLHQKDDSGTSDVQDAKVQFSTQGLAGRYIPYGGGQHLCPGRHYAKAQLIGTFAFFFSGYELQLTDSAKSAVVKSDMRWFPSGSLPPDRKVGFRIRKRKSQI